MRGPGAAWTRRARCETTAILVPRFFAFRSDRRMREALAEYFRVLSFTTVDADRNHFQSFVLEKPRTALP